MTFRPLPTPRQAVFACALAALSVLMCAALFGAAALAPAPPVVLPLVFAACVGCPMLAAWELPVSIAVLRAARQTTRDRRKVVDDLLRRLEDLPETEHPLGL